MAQGGKGTRSKGSIADPSYSSGDYFADAQRYSKDAGFKADSFLKLFFRATRGKPVSLDSFADVGCGSGDVIRIIRDSLLSNGYALTRFKAYDVSPHVQNIQSTGIEYIYGDFCASDEYVDVVTLFDVFEHVPEPIEFIKRVAERCRMIGLHIPLENSLNFALRNKFHSSLRDPGHLVFLDLVSALNLLALSGLRVIDYEYTLNFLAPSTPRTVHSIMLIPLRLLLSQLSPWVLSKTLGGIGLTVIALTPHGLLKP